MSYIRAWQFARETSVMVTQFAVRPMMVMAHATMGILQKRSRLAEKAISIILLSVTYLQIAFHESNISDDLT